MNSKGLTDDLILMGDVVTLDGKGTRAEAIAIRDGVIVSVGSRDAVQEHRDNATEVVDFSGAAIVPGFNDAHAHMDSGGLKLVFPSLAGARSIADVLERIAALTETRAAGSWIVTMPVGDPPFYFGGPAALAEGRMPTRHELDRVAPDHPVCILPPSGYWGTLPCRSALNSLALSLNGIDRTTVPRLPGIEIEKDGDGEPTGVFVDYNPRESAQLDLMPAVPKFSLEERRRAVLDGMRLYHAKGITSIYEGHGCTPEVISIYRDLWEADDLTMRVGMVVAPTWTDPVDAEPAMRDWLGFARGRGLGDANFRISGVHISIGGHPVASSLSRDFGNDTGFWNHTWQANEAEQFEELCLLAAAYDLRVHTVASTPEQIPRVVDALQRVHARHDLRGRRWVVEHLSACKPEYLDTFEKLDVGVTVLPAVHLWRGGPRFIDLSDADAPYLVPARALMERGVPVAGGTDSAPHDPLLNMQALMLREDRLTGRIFGAEARLNAQEALTVMTAAGAWFTFEETIKGRLLPGFLADCAVLSQNPLEIPAEQYGDIACIATIVGGAFVHRL